MQKKYLILSASYGSGHNVARDNISNYLRGKWDIVQSLDLTDLLKKWWDNSRKFYAFSEKIPFLWDATFNLLDQEFTNELLNLLFKSVYQKKFNEIIDEFNPDYVICTFPNWPVFIRNYTLKNKKTFKSAVIITDSIEIGMPWFYGCENIDYFFVIDDFSNKEFKRKFNHIKNNVFTSFFPIEEKYFIDKKTIKNENISILLTWLKKPFMLNLLELLKKEDFYKEINIIKWRNAKLFASLKKEVKNVKIKYHEFLDIKENLKNIDIFIAKPGWAIMSECIATDTPIISPSFIPGQEEWNIRLMKKAWVWLFEDNPEKVVFHLKYLDFNKFLPNFKNIKKKNAIEFIVEKMK